MKGLIETIADKEDLYEIVNHYAKWCHRSKLCSSREDQINYWEEQQIIAKKFLNKLAELKLEDK